MLSSITSETGMRASSIRLLRKSHTFLDLILSGGCCSRFAPTRRNHVSTSHRADTLDSSSKSALMCQSSVSGSVVRRETALVVNAGPVPPKRWLQIEDWLDLYSEFLEF